MPTNAEYDALSLTQIKVAIYEATANPKPNYSIGGRSVSWSEYLQGLLTAQEKMIAAAQGSAPFQIAVRTD